MVIFRRKCVKGRRLEKTETLSIMILRKRFAVIRDEPNRANGLAGLVLCLWRGYSLRMWAMVVLLFDIDCICEMGSCPWNDFLVRGVTLSMSGNARKGPHCIGIVFLCQKWRLWGLFFAGRDFAMKSILPPIRHNVFLTAGHSPFLELLTLQKGPIAPFSVTTPLLGRNETYRCLLAICGIGPKTASELVISIDIDDFPSHGGLASYCGPAPRNRQSSTSVSSVSASRQGNKRLKNLSHSRATAWRARMGARAGTTRGAAPAA